VIFPAKTAQLGSSVRVSSRPHDVAVVIARTGVRMSNARISFENPLLEFRTKCRGVSRIDRELS